jgi:hypothetical protein
MNRKTKRGSGVYEYLTATGLLANGTPDDIAHAKKEYWSSVRKEYRRNQRRECKSYTVFFTKQELKHITQQAKSLHGSITQYIKQAALNNGSGVDKKAIGEIRQGIALLYMAIQSLYEENQLSEHTTSVLLEQISAIETSVKGMLA